MASKSKGDFRHEDLDGYDSSFEDEDTSVPHKKQKQGQSQSAEATVTLQAAAAQSRHTEGLPSKQFFEDQQRRAESYRNHYFALNAYERHKKLISDYVLYYPGSKNLLRRDTSRDKNDRDIIQDHHRFLWDDGEDPSTWEKQLAKKYYDKLFKEYGLCDLSRYAENKIAIRWRTEAEVVEGKGQFICAEKKCPSKESLRTWEVNFAYLEDRVKKNALVKLRLCTPCSVKLNFKQQKKEVTKKPKKRKHKEGSSSDEKKHKSRSHRRVKSESEDKGAGGDKDTKADSEEAEASAAAASSSIWKETAAVPELKSREEEFDEYLDDLFL